MVKGLRGKGGSGYVFAALAAASYGTNPIFAKPLYADGMNPDSVLLFRYAFGILLLGLIMVGRGLRTHDLTTVFRVSRHSLPQLVILGILMALSSLTLFVSYNYMPVGIASTLLFTYPILVAVIMTLVYHEPMSWLVVICLLLATSGVGMLCATPDAIVPIRSDTIVSPFMIGVLMVLLSSLSYAIYLVGLNKTRVRTIASMPVTFYVLCFGFLLFVWRICFGGCSPGSHLGEAFTLPQHGLMWLNLIALGLLPTVVSLLFTAWAIQRIGSTSTALFGALEPVTAVTLGIIFLGESINLREFMGMVLIFVSVTLVVRRRR
ncbi:MAG: DMT family transporter [Bacteroidales bacterium]|nr:DMT family transporter [Bacteroidales bacterium]